MGASEMVHWEKVLDIKSVYLSTISRAPHGRRKERNITSCSLTPAPYMY